MSPCLYFCKSPFVACRAEYRTHQEKEQKQAHFYLHFTKAGGDTFSCYLPKLIFSFTFLPLPFIQPSFSSCLLLFFLWIFLLASPPTDI